MDRIRHRYKHLLNFVANVVLLGAEVLMFSYIWYVYYSDTIYLPFFRRGNWAVVAFYGFIVFLITRAMNGYKIGYLPLSDIWLSNALSIILSGIAAYFEIVLIGRIYVTPVPVAAMTVAQIAFMVVWVFIVRRAYIFIYPPRQILVVYADKRPDMLIAKMNSRQDKYDVAATISLSEGGDKVREEILKYQGVMLSDMPSEKRNRLLKYCYAHSIRVYVTPKVSDILLKSADDLHLFDTPLLLSRNQGFLITERFFKRIFDIIIALFFMVILSPFMLFTALCIKLYDGGPVFYRQDRLTQDKRDFMIIKFRSMKMDSEDKSGARLASKEDDRITPVGRVIRRIHFDEVPQLFNILKGDMSFVGPRPERRLIHDNYLKTIPEFDYRLKVKAGLTGYAQVYGKYNTSPLDKLKLDLTYIQNHTFWMDIKIILLTVKVIFQKENTEGIDASETVARTEIVHDR